MRYRLWLSILSVIFTVSLTANVSAEKWELPDVGKMEVPPHVHFEEGEQSALPFLQDKGVFYTEGSSKWKILYDDLF